MEAEDKDIVGQRIRQRRQELDLTQEQLAGRMQARGHGTLVRQRINMIENGRRYVRPAELIGFARVLRIPITWLLGTSDFDGR